MCELFDPTDNTAICHGKTVAEVRIKAETIIDEMLDWFCVNKMKANNDKLQCILFNRNGHLNDEHARIGNSEVKAES